MNGAQKNLLDSEIGRRGVQAEATNMSRATIDYGIDLGTTNSSIAVLTGIDVRVHGAGDAGDDRAGVGT